MPIICGMRGELIAAQSHPAHAVGDIVHAQYLQITGAYWVRSTCADHKSILVALCQLAETRLTPASCIQEPSLMDKTGAFKLARFRV